MRRESTGSWVWASVIPWGLVACDCGWAGLAAPLGRGRPRFSAVSPHPPAAICQPPCYTSPRRTGTLRPMGNMLWPLPCCTPVVLRPWGWGLKGQKPTTNTLDLKSSSWTH